MNQSISKFIINASELKNKINSNKIKIIDCRWFLNEPNKGFLEYKKAHIPNALYYDLEENSDKSHNLPHMFTSKEKFSDSINKLGISKENIIIIYDQVGFFCSCRIWYTFKTFGFKKIKILNGGFDSWKEKKFPVTAIVPLVKALIFSG